MHQPSAYDHIEPTSNAHPPGVYRVVGTDPETVTLLRVGDADGRRVHAGEVQVLALAALDEFEPAANPDGNRPPGERLASIARDSYWAVRAFGRQLTDRPLPAAVALLSIAVGTVGEGRIPLPDVAFPLAVVFGGLALAYVGSGRL